LNAAVVISRIWFKSTIKATELTVYLRFPGKLKSIFGHKKTTGLMQMQIENEPVTSTVRETFHFYIKDLRFHYGGVSFRHFVPSLQKRVEFTIINYNVREEFDAIKNYFINVFNSKKIEVSTVMECINGVPRLIEAHSPQIASIDERMLQAVKFEFVKDIATKKIKLECERTVLTMEEFFEALTNETVNASALYTSEQQFAEDLVKICNTRHYHHLRFLSGRHAYKIMRLRFILKPFSFLFLIQGEKHYHLIWETLDTEEATYTWPVEKDKPKLKEALQKTGDIINTIKTLGKKAYLSSSADNYRRVVHNYTLGIEGFIKWKDELESSLT